MQAIIEGHYFPPIQYFSKFYLYSSLIVSGNDRFRKQSYRNRCIISAANGIQSLNIPVKQGKNDLPLSKVEIDNSTNWQRQHWQSIKSAYGKAPFFEHYAPTLEVLINQHESLLFDFQAKIILECMKMLKIPHSLLTINHLEIDTIEQMVDLRNTIHPKPNLQQPDDLFIANPYMQVFSERFGFQPNLSIIDLLLNEGPAASNILKSCVVIKQ